MNKTSVFVSFDFDNDKELKHYPLTIPFSYI